MRKITKLFNAVIKSIDEENRRVTFCFSDDQPDRMKEIVEQSSWDTKNYEANPLILWGHDPKEPENVLGSGISLDINKAGKSYVTAEFDDETVNPKAAMVFKQLVKGRLRCVSAGFITKKEAVENGIVVLKDNELLEISIVPIPANPRAIALAFKSGELSKKDATWLMDGMRKEASLLEEELKQQPNEREVQMNEDVQKQMSAMFEGIKSLTEAQAKTDEKFTKFLEVQEKSLKVVQKGAVADILNADRGWDIDDAKWINMSIVSNMYCAFAEAYFYTATPVEDFAVLLQEFIELLTQVEAGTYDPDADEGSVSKALKTTDEVRVKELVAAFFKQKSAEAKHADAEPEKPATDPKKLEDAPEKKPEDEDEHKEDKTDELAKDGGDDQPGANEDDELDLDAELTPETKALIDDELKDVEIKE